MCSNITIVRERKGHATVVQLVARDLAKVELAGSSPVCRSYETKTMILGFGLLLF